MHRYITRINLAIVVALTCSPAIVAVAATDSWKDDSASWSDPSNWNPFGVPGAGDTVNIVDIDGVSRTITYNYTGPAITLGTLTIDLSGGAGSATNTLSMSANNLTTGQELVGTNGSGSFNQSGGTNTMNSADALVVGGISSGAIGTYTLSGGSLVANGHEFVGDSFDASGTFNHSGGTNTIAAGSFLILGGVSGAFGYYNLSDTGSLITNDDESVGDFGTGTFTQSGGSNTLNAGNNIFGSILHLGSAVGSMGTYTLSGGSLTAGLATDFDGAEFIGDAGTGIFNQMGGTNTTSAFWLAFNSNSHGTYTLNSGLLAVNQETVGNYGIGIFNQNGGINHVVVNGFYLGLNGAAGVGTYNLTAGSLLVDGAGPNEVVGVIGTGNFIQTGGTNSLPNGNLYLGGSSTGQGTYTLSDGSATIGGSVYVGGGYLSNPNGLGVFNVSDTGVLTIGGTLTVYSGVVGTSVNLSGGTINAAALNFNGNPALLNWTGGTLNLTTDVTFDSAAAPTSTSAAFGSALTLGTNQTLMVTGNETLGGIGPFALTLNPGSVHTVTSGLYLEDNGTLNLYGGTLNNTAFYQYGGTVNGTLVIPTNGTYVYIAGTFNGQLVNQGFVEFDETGFTAGNGMNNSGTVSPLANETVTFNGAGLINSSTIQGTSTNIIAASLTNSGQLSLIDSTLQAAGASCNTSTGLIEMIGGTLTGGPDSDHQLVNHGRINLIDVTVDGYLNCAADGVLNTAGMTTNNGNVTSSGQTYVGALNNTGVFQQTGGTLTGYGNFTNSGTAIFAGTQSWSPGTTFTNTAGSATFQSDAGSVADSPLTVAVNGGVVTFTVPQHLAALSIADPSGTLGLDLASPTSFGKAMVNGLLTAGGTLQVSLTNNFTPVAGNSFDLLDWGSLSGTFSSVDLPDMNGRIVWDSSQLYSTGTISVVATYYAGDFNRDGHVDAADIGPMMSAIANLSGYNAAHSSLTAAQLLDIEDVNGDGVVNDADLQALLDLLNSGGGSSKSVPEPASLVLLAAGSLMLMLLRGKALLARTALNYQHGRCA